MGRPSDMLPAAGSRGPLSLCPPHKVGWEKIIFKESGQNFEVWSRGDKKGGVALIRGDTLRF